MSKPPYGYRWVGEHKGALAINEETAPTMRRIFAEAAAGVSLHEIARRLNAAGVPTATGAGRWYQATLRVMLGREAYMGVARGRQTDSRKVNGRRLRIVRPQEEQILLPEGTIPPLVSPETFRAVQAQLEQNKLEAVRNHRKPEAFLLRAGFIRCGYCGHSIGSKASYVDNRGMTIPDRYRDAAHAPTCPMVWANAAEVDADIWARVQAILNDPAIIAREIARRRTSDPTEAGRNAVERALADVQRQQGNLARALGLLDDPDAQRPIMAELAGLGERRKALEAERAMLAAQYEAWRQDQTSLDSIEAWCRRIGEKLEQADYARKRKALTALGVQVYLYAADRTPRWEFTTAHRLDGAEIVEHPSRVAR
jgi:site-specific DNA recombinase